MNDRMNPGGTTRPPDKVFQVPLYDDFEELADTVLRLRLLSAVDCAARRLPIQRCVRFTARRPLDELFDDLALNSGLEAQRFAAAALLLDGPGVFVKARARRKTTYSSGTFDIWAETLDRLHEVRVRLLALVGEQRERAELVTIDWHFASGRGGLSNVSFDELADDNLYDEAYPTLAEPVATFIAHFLASKETVLVLQGPPGTGKTRLVRGILAAISRSKGDSAEVLYTTDRRTLETDHIFLEFVTGSHDAFVIEDADHVLAARSNGNKEMHRFLAVADGVVRALGRKIIFTTNLPNVGDIDEALLRPGRCFGVVRTRPLDGDEAERLVKRVLTDDAAARAAVAALPCDKRGVTLASIFRAMG